MKMLSWLGGLLIVLTAPLGMAGQTPPPACAPAGDVQFVCGQDAPEDLVLLPGSDWVIASVYSNSGGIRLIDTRAKATTIAYPAATAREKLDAKTYDSCPGVPDAAQKATFRTHGLAIRAGGNSVHTLYAVHHGQRESIEVFEVDARARPPVFTWIGCAVAPDPIGLNEVVALPEGGFIATDFLARGIDAAGRGRMLEGQNNGALWEWHTGKGWTMVPGSEASGANGLEISKDGKSLYVAAWGSQNFFRLTRGQSPVKRDVVPLGFRVDNIRWTPDGSLLAAGQGGVAPAQMTKVVKIDPDTLNVQQIIQRANTPEFGAGTVALQVGNEIWVGSFRGDRIAVFPAAR
jgi:DNA-binding beta-propeller fold protein YncE